MAKEWHLREDSLYEFYDAEEDGDKYTVPSFIKLGEQEWNESYFKERGITPANKFAYWNFNDGDPTWDPMPEHITMLEEAKAYTLFLWRMS